MFKFWYEKLISVMMPLLVFVSLFAVFFYAYITVWSVYSEPAENVPFIQEMRADAAKAVANNVVTMDKAHLADIEIKIWITKVVSESLSFNKQSYGEVSKEVRPYFTEEGFQKFQDYLISSGIAESIRGNHYDMSVYIEEPPLYLNSSTLNDVFKWLYQMPVVISFFPTGQKNIAQETDRFVNRKLNLRLQITRARVDGNPDVIQIEDWVVAGG